VSVKDSSLRKAEDELLSIIQLVQDGLLTPAEAMSDVKVINEGLKKTGKQIDYTLGDFILIRENALATYAPDPEEETQEEGYYDDEQ